MVFELVENDLDTNKESVLQQKKVTTMTCIEQNEESSSSTSDKEKIPSPFKSANSITAEFRDISNTIKEEHFYNKARKNRDIFLSQRNSFKSRITKATDENIKVRLEQAKHLKTLPISQISSEVAYKSPNINKHKEESAQKYLPTSLDEYSGVLTGDVSPNAPMSFESEYKQLPPTKEIPLLGIRTKSELRLHQNSPVVHAKKALLKYCLNSKNSCLETDEAIKELELDGKFQQDNEKVMKYMKKLETPLLKSKFYTPKPTLMMISFRR